jgi:glyoxylase-like metal-dependent hydrolase (beta-lactamase superfamily II)
MTTLAQAGVTLDAVITTHLHHDHVGWNTILTGSGRLEPTFPRARYLLVRDEYDYFTSPHVRPLLDRRGDYLADSVQPLADAGQLDLVPADHRVDNDIRPTLTPGHTPGHAAVEIVNGHTALLAADLIHHPLQLRHPEISAAMCIDPAASAAGRRHILDHPDRRASGAAVGS